MNKKVEIKKIVIKIGDKEIPLSLEEAKELKQILDETFGVKEKEYIYPYSPYIYIPYYPYITPHWTVTYGDVTCGTTATTLYLDCTSSSLYSSL